VSNPVARFLALFAVLAVGLLGASSAQAAGTPDVQLAASASSPLYGQSGSASAAAALANGQPKGYNLSFRAVLPAGISYAGGAEFPPQVINNAPSAGKTTLIFSNISDLVANSTQPVALNLTHDPNAYEVGDTYAVEWEAFVNTDPRYEPKFNAAGTVIGGSFTGSAAATSTSKINAIKVTKSEPSREGEILRGVHDNQTIYTLKLENNSINPTAATTLDDYLPAGLEFLGCAGTPDSTTDSPTNPGSPQEYPGSGPIVVQPVSDCFTPALVETVQLDPDLAGPMPFDIYTRVRWNTGTLAPGQQLTYRYRAAVPLAENTLDWTGPQPSPASNKQAANLDNNSGPEIRDEQDLTNYAIGAGTYKGSRGDLSVTSDTRLNRTGEDLVVYKSVVPGELAQGDGSVWELRFRTGEYRYSDDIVVTDTLPTGFCPLGPVNYTTQNDPSDSECNPTGDNPSVPYKSATENADGSFTIVWDKTVLPKFGHTQVNDEFALTFPTRTRKRYQSNFLPTTPILAVDSISNKVNLSGEAFSRCVSPGNPDCSTTGPRIWADAGQPEAVVDASAAGQSAPSVVLKKEVAASGTNCTTATYGKTLPVYRPGDKVCWRLTIDFPGKVDTKELTVTDFLPLNTTYIPGSVQDTAANTTVNSFDPSNAAAGVVSWDINGGLVPVGGQKFQVTLATTTTPIGVIDPSDIKGNLMKFAIQNTAGQAFPLRDLVNFEVIPPIVTIKKGVKQVNAGPIQNPPADGLLVRADDVATYQVDVKASNDDVSDVQVWDRLPAAFDCTAVSAISDGGVCFDGGSGRDVIKWTIPAIAVNATKSLTYKVQIPSDVGPENTYTNDSGVRQYKGETNTGGTYTYTPQNNIDPSNPNPPNIARVDDPSNVKTPDIGIIKSRSTSISETGNSAASQATIGEIINYTVTTTLPAGTTMKLNPRIVDTPNSLATQPIVGTPTALLNGNPLPSGWGISTSGQTVTVTMPDNYVIPNGSDHVVTMFISTRVADVSGNTRGQVRNNQATVQWTDTSNRSKTSNTVSTTIVEPSISQSKSNSTQPNSALPGDIVTYTLVTRNSSSGNVSIAHDTVIVDVVPVGMTPVDGGGAPLADGVAVPGTGGAIWNSGPRTITSSPVSINPGANVTWTYRAQIDDPAVAGNTLINTANAKTTSIGGSNPGERTSASTTSTGYSASSSSPVKITGATVTKAVDPAWATIGTPLTYTVDLTIPRDLAMFDLTAVDTLPDSLDFDGYVSSSCISGCPASPAPTVQNYNPVVTPSATTIAWDLGNITPGTTDRVIRFTFKAHVRDTYRSSGAKVLAGQSIVNVVRAQSNFTDKFTFNPNSLPAVNTFNYASPNATVTTPVREPNVSLDKRVKVNSGSFVNGPVQSQPGDTLTYSVAVKNNGSSAAYDVVVTDKPDTTLTNVVLAQGAAFNTDPWTQADPTMKWTIPGPIAPDETVTLTYTAQPLPAAQLNNSSKAINVAGSNYWGLPASERTNPWTYRNYDSNNDTVRVDFEFPEITVNKTTTAPGFPDIADASPLASFGWRIVVRNNATTARALDTVVRDTLPPAWTYDSGSTSITGAINAEPTVVTNPAGDVLTWNFAGQTIQPGASVTITFTAKPSLAARANPPIQVNEARADSKDASGSDRNLDGPYTARDDARAELKFPKSDLGIEKSAPVEVDVLQPFTYTMKVTNYGPDTATNVVITDPLPAGLVFVSSADCSPAMVCNLGTIASGASKTVTAQVNSTYAVAGTTVINTAVVKGDEYDTNPNNNEDSAPTRIKGIADVKITKTALPGNARPGDIVTYRLKAQNIGTAIARDVVVTDTLPVGVSFVSADAPCLESAGNISCSIGSMTPGDERILEVKVRVDQWGNANRNADHLLDVQKVEAQIDLDAGQQRTISVTCPSGYFASDGSVRIDHIDQGTGDWTAPQVLESRASSLGSWQGTVRNTATGRAQAKIFAVCVRQQTDAAGGHTHDLIVSDQITTSDSVLPGRREATLQCGPGQIAIQPGFISSAPADLVYSEPEGNGWKFALDVKAASDVTFSIRCLTRQVTITDGHTHDLKFDHFVKEFTIQPGQVNEAQLTCADGYKGIVADMDLDQGLVSLGNDPRPVTRAYKVYNPTDQALKARFSLLCLGDRTGGEHLPPKVIVNTAFITTSSIESSTANNMSSASFTAEDTDNFTPVDPEPPVKPTPNNPVATTIVGKGVTYAARSVVATLNCNGPCRGSVRLLSSGSRLVAGKRIRKGTVLARGSFRFNSAGKRKLKLRVNAAGRKVLKKGGRAVLKLSSGKTKLVRVR
jgi:uncharacterized repeat protein (TIGR01451 family)/fimbrial isopeptide formation D2 family protein